MNSGEVAGEVRELPAKVYDALQLSAAMYGGIGTSRFCLPHRSYGYWETPTDREGLVPVCYIGHVWMGGSIEAISVEVTLNGAFGISWSVNDTAVSAINERKRANLEARVTFEEWCAELNVVRGPEEISPRATPEKAAVEVTPEDCFTSGDPDDSDAEWWL